MRSPDIDFFNPYGHGFARVAVAVPHIRVADPAYNAGETIRMFGTATATRAKPWR